MGDCEDGGGCCPEKENDPTPMGRLNEFRHPGRALLNPPWEGSHETQGTGEKRQFGIFEPEQFLIVRTAPLKSEQCGD
jgi:hypothetical protein